MKWKLLISLLVLGCGWLLQGSFAQTGDKEEPKAPALGDKDDAVIQNQRLLKVRNDTKTTLTVSLQYRTQVKGVWTWTPDDPKNGATALSFEIEPGQEVSVKDKDELVSGSRMRIWATTDNQKWLTYKSKDSWLVPEKNDSGEHIYMNDSVETFTLVFAASKAATDVGGDTDKAGEVLLPTEVAGEVVPLPPPEDYPGGILPGDVPGGIPWDILPPDAGTPDGPPIIRDLAVLPVLVTGPNALVKVKNRGHMSLNLGRRLMVRKLLPGAVPNDMGPIGPLFHNGITAFDVIGLTAGNYEAYVSPGDDVPFNGNDKKTFIIPVATYSDLAVKNVVIIAGKVHIKVKNVGTAPSTPGQHLKVVKLLPGAVPVDHGPIGMLASNGTKLFPEFPLAAGAYKAFISAGDAAPYQANDQKTFIVPASTYADLTVLPVFVAGGVAHVKVKNVGTAPSVAGQNLKVVKLTPGAVPVDHGPIGGLGVGGVKIFPGFPVAAGNYKAYISPGDPPPHNGNDFDTFNVVAPAPDLEVTLPVKVGAKVKATIKNNGPAAYVAGARTWHLEKKTGMAWAAIPTAGSHVIPGMGPGGTHEVQGNFTGAGLYRIRLAPGDANAANDVKSKVLP